MKSTMQFLAILLAAVTASADMGSIPFKGGVQIYEPKQQALIAWSGTEEVMLLATQLRASEKTKVLEVMPLPSRPDVTKGEHRSLVLANNLIQWRTGRHPSESLSAGPFGGPAPPAGRVVEEKRIGAHDIKITEALDIDGFCAWALDYLKQQGAPDPKVPGKFKAVISDYLRDGFKWFVFDVVELGPSLVKKDVLRFQFKTDRMFFPLRITRMESGGTEVRLLILTSGPISPQQFIGYPRKNIAMPVPAITISSDEAKAIDESCWKVLGKPESGLLRSWVIQGELDSFQSDLLIAGKMAE